MDSKQLDAMAARSRARRATATPIACPVCGEIGANHYMSATAYLCGTRIMSTDEISQLPADDGELLAYDEGGDDD